jgi:hypothetical protein
MPLDPARVPTPHRNRNLTPEEQHRKVAEGQAFFAPEIPDPDALRSYMELYLAERTEWDEYPELGVVRTPYPDTVTGYALPIPAGTWDALNTPSRVLTILERKLWQEAKTEHMLLNQVDRTLLTDMVGVYFRHEGWAPARGTERTARSLLRMGVRPDFKSSADRRECRVITAVMIDGLVLRATQYKDDGHVINSGQYHLIKDAERGKSPHPADELGGEYLTHLLKIAYGLVAYMRPPRANEICQPGEAARVL